MENTFSLLWPKAQKPSAKSGVINQDTLRDLKLDTLSKTLSMDYLHPLTTDYITSLFTDDVDILRYRLDIAEDLLVSPQIITAFEEVIPLLELMKELNQQLMLNDMDQRQSIKRMVQLENYVACINRLTLGFSDVKCQSQGLKEFVAIVSETVRGELFQSLAQELERLRQGLSNLQSITIGFNLDRELRPVEAIVLSLNDYKIKEKNFIEKLDGNSASHKGISTLFNVGKEIKSDELALTVFNNVSRLMKPLFRSVALTMGKYVNINTKMFISLKQEFEYWIGAVRFIRRMRQNGLSLCKPVLCSKAERKTRINNIYNVFLANELIQEGREDISRIVVANDVKSEGSERVFIITGPNQGGKTTYTQAIALAHFMCQIGLYVPGTEADISPVDSIYTHFPAEEKPESKIGRLGEESKRLNDIFSQATKYSLILLNESLSSTSPGESLYLSQEIVSAFKVLGARVYFNTHLHELAEKIDVINTEVKGDSRVVSLVAGVVSHDPASEEQIHQRTYKVYPAPPLGISYARDIANQYGLSFEAITNKLRSYQRLDA